MIKKLFSVFLLLLMVGTVGATTVTIPFQEDSTTSHYNGAWDTNHILSWYKVQAGTTTYFNRTSPTSGVWINTYENPVYRRMDRGLLTINLSNTSQIPAGSTITGATAKLWGSSKDSSNFINLTARLTNATPTSPYAHVYGDYNKYSDIMMSDNNITKAAWVLDSENDFVLNAAGIQLLQSNLGGSATLAVRSGMDINMVVEGSYINYLDVYLQYYTSESTNSTLKPSITITFTTEEADTTPPASITDLTNITTCQNITWQWTNPTDVDFGGIHDWLNNAAQGDITNVTTSKLFEGLTENTPYTFSTKTFDLTGNTNDTWVNLTSTTDTCPVPTTSPTTTATTAPPTTTTASPTPTPTPTPLEGCIYFNLTGVTFGENSTDWNVTEGLNTWGVSTFNATQGNVSWWICRATPTTTAPPIWRPVINPSTDIKTDWLGLLWQWWWLPVLIIVMILLFRRK